MARLRRGFAPVMALSLLLTPGIVAAAEVPTAPYSGAIGLGHGDPVPAIGDPTILFINFEGAQLRSGCGNDSHEDCSTLIPLLGDEIMPYPESGVIKAAIGQAVRADLAAYDVMVVTERPNAGVEYAMVIVGDPAIGGAEDLGFGGVAPTIDCGNSDPSLTSFALNLGTSAELMATVILQEAAHTWGLEHVDDTTDTMFPVASSAIAARVRDRCSGIVTGSDLTPGGGFCNEIHTQFCELGQQNGHQELLLLFGPSASGDSPPEVEIMAPAPGESIGVDDFQLVVRLDDDNDDMVDVAVLVDGVTVQQGQKPLGVVTYPMDGASLSGGPHTITVTAEDSVGGMGAAEIEIGVGGDTDSGAALTAGNGQITLGGASGSAPSELEGCGCRQRDRGVPWAWLWLLAPIVRRRVRRHPT